MATISGGAKAEAYIADLVARAGNPASVKVGFLAGATYPDGTSVAMVAAIQNFGAPSRGIPPRPFFSNMVEAKHNQWGPATAMAMQRTNDNAAKALGIVGAGIAGQLQQSIRDTNSPPLKPATVARKGFDKPLIDTGHMLNSVSYEVTS